MTTAANRTIEDMTNLETFYLICLDTSLTNELQQQLRTIINYFLVFDDDQHCLQYLQSLHRDDRVIFIIKNRLAQSFLPQVVHLPQIVSIYIHSHERKAIEAWTKNFKKIRGIITRRDELAPRIQSDYSQRQLEDVLVLNIFNSKQPTTSSNNRFLHCQILVDCLLHTDPSSDDRKKFLSLCKQQYTNNPLELNLLEEFEKDYVSQRSIWWYTRHSFLYQILTKALRLSNIDVLLLLRFFLRDLRDELKTNKCLSSIRVYRAQWMPTDQLELLSQSLGEFLSVNSFLSTSPHREQTRSLLTSSTLADDGMERVFFEINANPQQDHLKPFSNITSYSYSPKKEEEVLFMFGSIFRLVHLDRDVDGIWNIQLVLCSNHDPQVQVPIQEKKNALNIIDSDSLSIAFLLEDMGREDDAEKYYLHILDQLSKDQEDRLRCYHALGEITQKKGDYSSSLKWLNKALEIDMELCKADDPDIATSHNSMAVVYSRKGDYTLAMEAFEKALQIWRKAFGEDHLDVAMCFNNMGIVYEETGKYADALEYYHKAWNIRQIHLSSDHPSLGQLHACIGNVHYHLKRLDLALEHYNLALEIWEKSSLAHQLDMGMIFRNVGLIYREKGEFFQALTYLEKAVTTYRQILPSTHSDIVQIGKIIRQLLLKL